MTFLIYINDITENIKSNIKLFVDGTSLYATTDEDAVTATNQLNNNSSEFSKWADTWLVIFNAGVRYNLHPRNFTTPGLKYNCEIFTPTMKFTWG